MTLVAPVPNAWRARLSLTPNEFMALTGISRSATYRLVNDGKIKTIRIGRAIRIPTSAAIQFVEGE